MSAPNSQRRGPLHSRLHLSGETVERIVEEFRDHVLRTRRPAKVKREASPGAQPRTPGPDADST